MIEKEFVKAVEENSKRVFLIALSFTKNTQDAEDIMQNAFLKLWKSREKFQSDEHIAKWLTVVASNESKNLLRFRAKSMRFSEIDMSTDFEFDSCEDRDIFDAVMMLPPKLSLVIHLFYYEDLSVEEISKTLNISQNAVKTRLSRGREKLKDILGGVWKDE